MSNDSLSELYPQWRLKVLQSRRDYNVIVSHVESEMRRLRDDREHLRRLAEALDELTAILTDISSFAELEGDWPTLDAELNAAHGELRELAQQLEGSST